MKRLCLAIAVLLLMGAASAQEIRRPTLEINDASHCSGTALSSSPMPNVYDAAGNTTSSSLYADSNSPTMYKAGRTFYGFPAASRSYQAVRLYIDASCGVGGTAAIGSCKYFYSLDGGSTWSAAGSETILPATQDLTKLQVNMCVTAKGLKLVEEYLDTYTTLEGYDIRTEATSSSRTRLQVTTEE